MPKRGINNPVVIYKFRDTLYFKNACSNATSPPGSPPATFASSTSNSEKKEILLVNL